MSEPSLDLNLVLADDFVDAVLGWVALASRVEALAPAQRQPAPVADDALDALVGLVHLGRTLRGLIDDVGGDAAPQRAAAEVAGRELLR